MIARTAGQHQSKNRKQKEFCRFHADTIEEPPVHGQAKSSPNLRQKIGDQSSLSVDLLHYAADSDVPLCKADSDGTTTDYIWTPFGLIAQIKNGVVTFIHSDELGNVIALSDTNGNVVAQTCYGPYGDVWTRTGTADTPWGFGGANGVYTDPDVELLQMQARYYSPEMKRFISADPTGLNGGVNFYTYADGNPLNSIDPEGLCARPSLFGRTSQFGVRSANFGGFSQFGRTPGIASSYSSFGRPSSSPFGFSSPRSYYALSSPGYQMFDDSRNKWDSGHRWAAVGSAVREAFGRTSGFDQINSASSGYDTYSMHSLSAGQRLSAGVSGTISVGFWAAGSVGTLGRGVSVMAGTLTRSEVAASRATIANALPRNQTFARVMPMQHAENFLHGNGPIGLGGKYNEVFVTAADDLVGIKNVRNAQQRLGLFRNSAGTLPNLRGDAVVEFKLKSLNKAGWRSPIETRSPRGYGFMYGGKTSGDAREWLINSGTASEIEAYDIILRRLEP